MNWSAWAVETRSPDTRQLHVVVTAEAAPGEERDPVLLNLVLDRSGSMKGAPLSAAVEAAQQLVEGCGAEDFVGLVLFDGVAEQRVPVTAMDGRGKRALLEGLAGIQPGRGTALHQALELAARGLQRTLVPGRRARLLLLTDGEPSVGHDTVDAFEELGRQLAGQRISVHALGLARHYMADILGAVTQPSGNAFEHVDGPDGLPEAMGAVSARLHGQVATEAAIRVQPGGLSSVSCRHAYPTQVESDALLVSVGDVSRGHARRVLFTGGLSEGPWELLVHGQWKERGDTRSHRVEVEVVAASSPRGRLALGLGHELQLVSAETAAWLSLARRELERAESQLESAESDLRELTALAPEGLPVKRHAERLADLRLAVERGEGDIPLLIRRARSAQAGANVSQVIPFPGAGKRR